MISVNSLAGHLIVTWDRIEDAEGYVVKYGTENLTSHATTSGTQFKILNVIEGRTYFISVSSINQLKESRSSKILKFKVPAKRETKSLEIPNPKLIFQNINE